MDEFKLKEQFSVEFFNEFQFDAEFRTLFESMVRGMSPYEAIERLCKNKKELFQLLERVINESPRTINFNPK